MLETYRSRNRLLKFHPVHCRIMLQNANTVTNMICKISEQKFSASACHVRDEATLRWWKEYVSKACLAILIDWQRVFYSMPDAFSSFFLNNSAVTFLTSKRSTLVSSCLGSSVLESDTLPSRPRLMVSPRSCILFHFLIITFARQRSHFEDAIAEHSQNVNQHENKVRCPCSTIESAPSRCLDTTKRSRSNRPFLLCRCDTLFYLFV